MDIRAATNADLPALLDLAAAKRHEYATYSPIFWRVAADAREQQEPFFLDQRIANPHALVLVAERGGTIEGFVMAVLHSAPPVYDPGGLVCTIDDYTVAHPDLWPTVGTALLNEASRWAKAQGAVLVIVVAGYLDEAKRRALENTGATVASEWWVKPLSPDCS